MEVRARPKDVNIVQNVYQNAVAGEYHGLAGRTRRQDQDTHMFMDCLAGSWWPQRRRRRWARRRRASCTSLR